MNPFTCSWCQGTFEVADEGGLLVCPGCGQSLPGKEPHQPLVVAPDPATRAISPHAEAAAFRKALAELTPHVFVTPVLIAINVVVFLVMVANGVDPLNPNPESLIPWGADIDAKTAAGEYWRLLTSMFLHVGILHLAVNLWVLWMVGRLVERLFGNLGFALVYFLSGLGGSLASTVWNPLMVSVGASGAIFGVFAALGGFLVRYPHVIPKKELRRLILGTVVFVGYNLVFGSMTPGIALAAHAGGLVVGFVCGLALGQEPDPASISSRRLRNLIVAGSGGLLVAGAILFLPEGRHVDAALDRQALLEQKAMGISSIIARQRQWGAITDEDFLDRIEQDILPEWRATYARLASLEFIPPHRREYLSELLAYMKVRQESWELFAQATREKNQAKGAQAVSKWEAANLLRQKLNARADKESW
jgi:rhomboid protease GluP